MYVCCVCCLEKVGGEGEWCDEKLVFECKCCQNWQGEQLGYCGQFGLQLQLFICLNESYSFVVSGVYGFVVIIMVSVRVSVCVGVVIWLYYSVVVIMFIIQKVCCVGMVKLVSSVQLSVVVIVVVVVVLCVGSCIIVVGMWCQLKEISYVKSLEISVICSLEMDIRCVMLVWLKSCYFLIEIVCWLLIVSVVRILVVGVVLSLFLKCLCIVLCVCFKQLRRLLWVLRCLCLLWLCMQLVVLMLCFRSYVLQLKLCGLMCLCGWCSCIVNS